MSDKPLYINEPDALVTAAYEGEFHLVRSLVVAGADPNMTNEYGETAVMVAAEHGYDAIVEFLLNQGTNINAKNRDGDTALDIAKYHNCKDTVELPRSRGALGTEGPSAKEQMMSAYNDAVDSIQKNYLDDRMFVLELSRVTSRSLPGTGSNERTKWTVITRRNVPGYPPIRCDEFDCRDDAVAYLKQIAPQTPSWEALQAWLESIGAERLPY